MNKILFLQPSYKKKNKAYRSYSPALGVLASFLKSEFEITIYDLVVEDYILDSIDLNAFDIIAMTLLTPAVPAAQKILQNIKTLSKKIPTIAGGPHATFLPDETLSLGFDYIITGRTGSDVIKIFRNILDGHQKDKIINTHINRGEDLSICIDYFDLSKYAEHIFFTSIGCPYKCIFCSNKSFSVYERDLGKLFTEISYALSLRTMPIFFSDDVFITSQNRFDRFCKIYKTNFGKIPFTVQMRADSITPFKAESLAIAGCERIILGVESGSETTLDIFNKKIDQMQIITAIKSIESASIRTRMNYIVGMLGDTAPEYNIARIAELARPSEVSIHQLIPFPGSALWDDPEKYGIAIKNKYDFGEYNFSEISDNFTYESFGKRSTYEVIEACIDKLRSLGYREPGESSNGPFLVTPLSPIRFAY